jgi:hypothetical protein
MKDMREQLEKLRQHVAECELIRDLATERSKRELFGRLANQLKMLAAEVESAMGDQAPITFLGRKTQEPFPNEKE